jgi:uncharacterized protein (TIGR00725 family)
MRKPLVAIIGTSDASPAEAKVAEEAGRLIAEHGWALVTGGLGGVMEAASRGAAEAGGVVVGILPQGEAAAANRYVQIPIATNMGFARNAIIVHSAEAVIAVGGGHGTLSEIGYALKLRKPIVGIGSWEIPGVAQVPDAHAAVEACAASLAERAPR